MKNSNKKEKNYGISILRVILSFMVVIDHFYDKKRKKKFLYILYYHIPTFYLLSFYFTYNTFSSFNVSKIKLRFERLIIPYISYTTIGFILNNIYYYSFNKNCKHQISDFLESLINGHIFVIPLWFQYDLIFITLILAIIIFTFKHNYSLILLNLFILSYLLQYSGVNYHFIKNNFTVHYSLTYGRFLESLPNSISGFFIASFRLVDKLKYFKLKSIILGIIIIIIISIFKFDIKLLSFKYGGIRKNIASICLFEIFYFICNNINRYFIKIIDIVTKYTAGIYFLHTIIGHGYIMKFILGKKINTINGCFILYIITYIVCFLMDKLIGKTKLMHLIK